jgi:hypothetical protein
MILKPEIIHHQDLVCFPLPSKQLDNFRLNQKDFVLFFERIFAFSIIDLSMVNVNFVFTTFLFVAKLQI